MYKCIMPYIARHQSSCRWAGQGLFLDPFATKFANRRSAICKPFPNGTRVETLCMDMRLLQSYLFMFESLIRSQTDRVMSTYVEGGEERRGTKGISTYVEGGEER